MSGWKGRAPIDRETFNAAYSRYGDLLPSDAPSSELLRGYLYVDDVEVVDQAIRRLLPFTIRSWLRDSAKSHRLRWAKRADRIEALPHVSSWPTTTSILRRSDAQRTFMAMRVERVMPDGWEQLTQHLTGTGDLGWLAWTIQQMTRYAADIERNADWSPCRYDWVEACLAGAEPLIGREGAGRLLGFP
jgi:hypothetical protein